jgi:glycosyltransferase involved in cell wall biosynthesis
MHILIIHQFFLGAGDPGGSRFNEMARIWREQGHEVTVVAGMVHYQTGRKPEHYRGRWIVDERLPDGVRVRRTHVSESYNRSFLGRLWGYLSFMLSATHAGVTASRPDVVIASSPPLFAGLSGWVVARRWRVAFVFEVRDLWPESAIDTGVLTNPLLIRLSYRLEHFLYRVAERVNVLTPAFSRALIERKGVAPDKLLFIPNGADADSMRPGPKMNWVRERFGLGDRFVVAYLGALGVANHLEQLIEAATLLRDCPQFVFLIVGDGMRRAALEEMVRMRGLANVLIIGSVPKDQAADICNAADVCAAVLKRVDTFKTVYPNKVFDYMACQRPVLIAIDGVARELVEQAGAGVYVEPENALALAGALERMERDPESLRAMGESGRRYVESHFARESLARSYSHELEHLVGSAGGAVREYPVDS